MAATTNDPKALDPSVADDPEGIDEMGVRDTGHDPADRDERGAEPAPGEGAAARPAAGFDPTPYMRQLRGRGGGQDYLDVKWRLLWLRREHPDAEIVTEHVQIEPDLAIFKATVSLPTGGKATGYGSETAADFGDFIEKAETKAIGRALNALGYGAQFGERGEEEAAAPPPRFAPRPPAEPPRRSERAARPPAGPPAETERPAAAPAARAAARPAPDRARAGGADIEADGSGRGRGDADAPGEERSAAPIDLAANRDRLATPPRAGDGGRPSRGAAAAAGDPDLADYSWTAFWPWARSLGLNGPQAIEALIGQAVAGFSPAQLRERILKARGEG